MNGICINCGSENLKMPRDTEKPTTNVFCSKCGTSVPYSLHAGLHEARNIITGTNEINPSNYDHNQVCEMNTNMLYLWELLCKNMFGANIAQVQENIIMDIKNRMNTGQF